MDKKLMEERLARDIIDDKLRQDGWRILKEEEDVPLNGFYAKEEVQTESGPMDYGLYINGILIGDIEAKPEKSGVPAVLYQAERYSQSYSKGEFDFDGYRIPFLYSSNGHVIWFKDIRSKYNPL